MNNASSLDRAFAIIARVNAARTPAARVQRAASAARKVLRLAGGVDSIAQIQKALALYWLGSALYAHGEALALEGVSDCKVAYRTGKRDRCLQLMVLAANKR